MLYVVFEKRTEQKGEKNEKKCGSLVGGPHPQGLALVRPNRNHAPVHMCATSYDTASRPCDLYI
jgi:hypothetical protein